MSCRRVCRELLWLARFGELGPSSQPHLDHLAGCRGCRDEVGFDREMVRQLRIALAARVEGMQPPASAWEAILRRAQAPEPSRFVSWWQRSVGLVGRLRTATAIAGTGLALVLALNMEVVPVTRGAPVDTSVESPDLSMLEDPMPFAAQASHATAAAGEVAVTPARPHPEATLTLPPSRAAASEEPTEETGDAPPGEYVVLEIRFGRSSASVPPASAADEPAPADEASAPAPAPSPAEPGQPS